MAIPILMYHSIIDNDHESVSINLFKKQMMLMKKMGYQTINFDNLNKKENKKNFIITFDDGYESVFLNAFPILKKLNFNATCFIVTNKIGDFNEWDKNKRNFKKKKLMNFAQINEWIQNGFRIGSHTKDHKDLTKIDINGKIDQISNSKIFLNDMFSTKIDSFAFPFGSYDNDTHNIVKDHYDFAVTTKRSRYFNDKFDNILLPRIPINKSDNLFKFFLKIITPYEDVKFKKNVN